MNKQQKYFVTGWHHSGTTVVQHAIALQLGFNIQERLPESFFGDKMGLARIRKAPSNGPRFIEEMYKIIDSKKRNIHVVLVIRDANELISSLYRRGTDKELPSTLPGGIKIEMENYAEVLKFLVDVFTKSYNNYTVIDLRSFVEDPISHLERLGFKNPINVEKTSNSKRPKDTDHEELRAWQTKQRISKDIVQPATKKYPESLQIEKYHTILKNNGH